ncbi:MAG: glutamate--tRNA ligase [Planctomycetes bacterium]|nr:glutamate--tRNA ligase [Planctomycetota bacterium]
MNDSTHSGLTVTRFAPSPTGHLHIGGARTALFCWAFAKRTGGKFILRIEDTDLARSSEESARGIMEDLAWLGIEWDEGPVLRHLGGQRPIGGDPRHVGPFFQAQRLALYNQYIESLVRAGRAYPAFETGDDLEVKRKAATAAKKTYRYERPADVQPGVFNEDRWQQACRGDAHVVRFLAPHEQIVVPDQVLGDVKIAPGELDDFVIRKADGMPTYHFAVVIDDELMGVTHVLRAQEHLANTPRHVAMQKALRRTDTGAPFRTPLYGHMPLIFNMDGSKMSKRDKAKIARASLKAAMQKDPSLTPASLAMTLGIDEAALTGFIAADNDALDTAERIARHLKIALPEIEVSDFRGNGYLPGAIVNFLALLGWNPGLKTQDGKDLEKFDAAFIADHFDLARIGKANAKFDRNKLLSFNAEAIGALTAAEFARRWMEWLAEFEPEIHAKASRLSAEQLTILAGALKPRAKTLRDALRPAAFALAGDDEYTFDAAAVEKNLLSADRAGMKLLVEFRGRLDTVEPWTPEAITAAIDAFAKEKGMPNPGGIAQPLRVALTGAGVSPGLGETMAVLGKASSLRRIDRCVQTHGA